MYNLASILKSILDQLDDKKCKELEALKRDSSGMTSFHTSGTWKTNKAESSERRMGTIHEEGQDSEPMDEDDLGVFGNNAISAALSQMNYQVAYVAHGVCVP